MNEISNIFSNLGFPVAMVVVLLYFLYKKVWTRIETTLDRVTKTNEELSESNRILSQSMDEKMSALNKKVDKIIDLRGEM